MSRAYGGGGSGGGGSTTIDGGTVEIENDEGNPIPVTSTDLTSGDQQTQIVDSTGANVANVDSNGALRTQSGGTPGTAVPNRATQVGGSDGTNLRTIRTDTTGYQIMVGDVQAAATDANTAPVKIGGKFNTTPQTLSDGQRGQIQLDANSNLRVAEQLQPVYEDNNAGVAKVEQRFQAQRINTNTTTVLKSASGMIHTVTVGVAGTTSTITIYDNTAGSGTILAVISSTDVGSFHIDSQFATGLTIVTAGGAAADISVSFR